MHTPAPCPKCDHDEILYVPRLHSDSVPSGNLMVHIQGGFSTKTYGQLAAYICRKCGFTELYAAQPAEIPVAKIEGAQIIRAQR